MTDDRSYGKIALALRMQGLALEWATAASEARRAGNEDYAQCLTECAAQLMAALDEKGDTEHGNEEEGSKTPPT